MGAGRSKRNRQNKREYAKNVVDAVQVQWNHGYALVGLMWSLREFTLAAWVG